MVAQMKLAYSSVCDENYLCGRLANGDVASRNTQGCCVIPHGAVDRYVLFSQLIFFFIHKQYNILCTNFIHMVSVILFIFLLSTNTQIHLFRYYYRLILSLQVTLH